MAAATVPAFDQVSVSVRPGSDVVARMPGVLLVARAADTDEADVALKTVLELLETSSQTGTRAPGYRVGRALRDLIDSGAAPGDLALVAATDDGLAVVLSGTGAVTVAERGWQLTGQNGQVLIREVAWPPAPLLVELREPEAESERGHAAPSAEEAPARRSAVAFDLRAGVVPGSGAVLGSPPAGSLPSTGTIQAGSEAVPAPLVGTSPTAPGPHPARRRDPILGVAPSVPARPALPVIAAGTPAQEAAGAARVHGYRCREGHLNDPRTLFCAICGIRMAESTGVYVEGPRPPLGLLVFDNGASFSLDDNYLLGRDPDVDDRVRAGQLRPLVLFDSSGVISRRHAEIRLEDWDVLLIDCGSANGTLVAEREATEWSALVPGQPIRMLPSMQVRIGERTFVFESLHGAP